MKRFLCWPIVLSLLFLSTGSLFAKEVKSPEEAAKEYVAKKFNCTVKSLETGDTFIGRSGAYIDVEHGYETEKVKLIRKDFESDWEVEGSEPLEQY